ncbi:hypothetical protein COY33_02665 [candidate division WWE3 bacterium CG_4_10_14_0_2_um_filter_42_7]|uniref:Uncharacterized protein n=2 Tax=Katanobacteria TaxID=422282 RepID=A0A2H0XC23_UNCKA|nr:MAG: hypothetical protein COT51_01205 [candidate division WWE3 bacterium CG08_land_8_20_14_0_20_41_15]PIZ42762.1 MAG: hypothetical protein COY33_02665 [candidate division WWE3 bacterium CG_4_10_14_0_2_um_filter_42_7]
MANPQSIEELLRDRDPRKGSYAKYEWQAFGYELMRKLDDPKHRGIYMRLSKNEDRSLLMKALETAIDGNPRSRARVFMWKLKELRKLKKEKELGELVKS